MSHDDVVGALESGMTIAIGGWGSRRKPMSLVRAIARSDLADLTIVSWGGPDLGVLCAAGKVRRAVFAFCSLDSIPLEPHFRNARQSGAVEQEPWDEGLFHLGLQAAAWRVPFLPSRAGLGSDLFRDNPRLRTVRSPYDDDEQLVAGTGVRVRRRPLPREPRRHPGERRPHRPDPYWDDMMLAAAPPGRRFVSTERIVDTRDLSVDGCVHQLRISRATVDGVVEAPGGAHFTSCDPDYGRDEQFQRRYARSAASASAWQDSGRRGSTSPRTSTSSAGGRRPRREHGGVDARRDLRGRGRRVLPRRRGDPRQPDGLRPDGRGRLARATFEPDLLMTDGEAALIANDEAFAWPDGRVVESWNPYRSMFDWVFSAAVT